jgi:hypothetical protein
MITMTCDLSAPESAHTAGTGVDEDALLRHHQPISEVDGGRVRQVSVAPTPPAVRQVRRGRSRVGHAQRPGRLAAPEEQGVHAEVTLPGPVPAGGLTPAMCLGATTDKSLDVA